MSEKNWPPEGFDDLVTDEQLPSVIAELERIAEEAPNEPRVGAIHVLKNELGQFRSGLEHRELEYSRVFCLPGTWGYRWGRLREWAREEGWGAALRRLLDDFAAWFRGEDNERFRDRCDHYFWAEIVPEIEANFGDLAEPMANTVNEAIINYAEHSFGPRAMRRRVKAHLFKTEGELGYAIVRPFGTKLVTFDPLQLKQKKLTDLKTGKRGWGFTIMLSRALFISFDSTPRRRGMMIIVGPDEESGG